jgi:hypothetical protein
MDAAFDDSDDEGDDSESRPLNPAPTSPRATHSSRPSAHIPGTYDFENVDYDYPPPGSPPGPSAVALPNEFGNSNGLVPDTFDVNSAAPGPRRGWFSRTAAAVLPSHYIQRFGMGSRNQVIGNNNDGVFANVTAKPTPPIRVQDGNESQSPSILLSDVVQQGTIRTLFPRTPVPKRPLHTLLRKLMLCHNIGRLPFMQWVVSCLTCH